MSSSATRILGLIAAIGVVPSALVALIGQTGAWWWLGDLCSHWTLHAALGLIVGAVVWRRSAAISRGCVVLMLVALIPWIRHAFAERAPAADRPALTIAWSNLYRFNTHRAEALAGLLDRGDDLLGLTEVTADDEAVLRKDTRWPFQVWTERNHILACALLSKRRIVTHGIHPVEDTEMIAAVVDAGESPLRVLVAHLTAPLSPERWEQRNRQIAALAQLANRQDLPTLVLGDFNATPAAALWRPFLIASGLQPAPGFTLATWPAWSSPWPRCPGLAIDHILVRAGRLTPTTAFSVPGSDHLGLAFGWMPLAP